MAGVKPDDWIREMALKQGMIEPFQEGQVGRSCISFGVSSYGYDFRLHDEFQVFRGGSEDRLDPKNLDEALFEHVQEESCLIPAGGYLLARSLEYFRIPRDVLTLCTGKSTYARCGVLVNVTPFEPEWEGFVTVSIANLAPSPVKIYAGEGIAQVVFVGADQPCSVSYRDRKGKYQAQQEIVHSKVTTDDSSPEGM